MATPEELALYEQVKTTGTCHDNVLKWERVDIGVTEIVNGEKVNSVQKKAKTVCPTCSREYVKSVQVVNLDDY